jgi:AcrR family transcriptional regulator
LEAKDRIIKTALKIFMKKGYDSASMSDVVAETQLSKGGIYHHFKNKKDLFLKCVDFMLSEFIKWEEELYSMEMSVKEILKTYLGSLGVIHEFVVDLTDSDEVNVDQFYTLIMEAFVKFPEIKESHIQTHEHNMNNLARMLETAQQEGIIKPDIDCAILGFMIKAMAEGTVLYHILNERIDLNEMGSKLFATLWNEISTEGN